MIFCTNNFGQKREYLERFLFYYSTQLEICADREQAFLFAQEHFLNDYGFLLYKRLELFLGELIEIKEIHISR
jgi:hypothetical protein